MPTVKTAVILDAGKGTRLWPYAQIRSKGMLPVSGKPLLRHLVASLRRIGIEETVIVGGAFAQQVKHAFRLEPDVRVVEDATARGAAFSLLAAKAALGAAAEQGFLALYSDTLVTEPDLAALKAAFEAQGEPTALLSPLHPPVIPDVPLPARRSCDHIVCSIENGCVAEILGHPREEGSHSFAGFAFSDAVFPALAANAGRFTQTEVGMMPPLEGFIEATLADLIAQGERVLAVEAEAHVVDIDKPWQILEANFFLNMLRCTGLRGNTLAEGASIHPSAAIAGNVQLGE
ncbi:MAG: NDP-sugar synthase, partial [Oscillospiraceae bacterium]|nr:NDP-sugar synthase [Oscillospiraceae bacterium]